MLEKYYPGDDPWKKFVEIHKNDEEVPQKLVSNLNGHVDLAFVIFTKMGDQSLVWINTQLPALDGITPKNCLHQFSLIKRLKTMLMRMP